MIVVEKVDVTKFMSDLLITLPNVTCINCNQLELLTKSLQMNKLVLGDRLAKVIGTDMEFN